MQSGSPRERLLIGEAAGLLGVTPKTVRHYERLGLLEKPERSGSGYRLYTAEDLLRLRRIKKLRSLGLPLKKIKASLQEEPSGEQMKPVLKTLLGEVEARIEALEEQRERLKEALAGEDAKVPPEEPYVVRVWKERFQEISPEALEQERKLWTILDAFEWPEGYREFQEEIVRYFESNPETFEKIVGLGERFAALAQTSEDSPEVKRLANELREMFREDPLPAEVFQKEALRPGPLGSALGGLILSHLSPAQRRCVELANEAGPEGEDVGEGFGSS